MRKSAALLLFLMGFVSFDPGNVPTVSHMVKGRILAVGRGSSSQVDIILQRHDNSVFGEQRPGYDGDFIFKAVPSGEYLLLIKPKEGATVARPIKISDYPKPKIIFLDIRLGSDGSANIRELVKEFSIEANSSREEKTTRVSGKAQKEFDLALRESERGNSSTAIEHLQKAIHEAPDFFEAYNNLGAQYQKLKKFEAAISAYQKASSLRDETAKPHINLGMIYWGQGKLDEAVGEFNQALKFDPNLPLANLSLGRVLLQKKQYHLAEPYLELATRLDPKNSRQGFLDLIRLYRAHNEWDRANYFLEKLLDYFPNDPEGSELKRNTPNEILLPESP
jgi:Tfp pilus assembly protein PilF